MNKITPVQFAKYFDHTQLKANATKEDLRKLCQESLDYGFAMVAINSCQVKACKELLKDTDVHVGAAISFPLGQTSIEAKVFETEDAIKNGADEIDYVINITKLKEKDYVYLEDEMSRIVEVCRKSNVLSKVIFENCYLTDDEIVKMAEIALEVKPDYIKTSTGFGTHGATIEHVKLMKSVVGDKVKVKAAGGIRDLQTTLAMIEAGADRIGSSAGVAINDEYKSLYEANK